MSEFFFTTRIEHIEKEIFAATVLSLAPPDAENNTSIADDPPKMALETLYKDAADKKQEKLEWFEQWAKNSSAGFRRK